MTMNYHKVRKTVKIRNRSNQVSHLTQDTIWESNKTQDITHQKTQRSDVS